MMITAEIEIARDFAFRSTFLLWRSVCLRVLINLIAQVVFYGLDAFRSFRALGLSLVSSPDGLF